MTLKQETPKTDYTADWPEHYYDTEDCNIRRDTLNTVMTRNQPSEEDILRKRYLDHRFFDGGKGDRFMRAWLLIRIMENDHVSFLNRKRKEKEIRSLMEDLCVSETDPDPVLKEEWKDFARTLIAISCSSRQYRAAAFGLFQMNDHAAAQKIIHDIDTVTVKIPAKFGLAAQFAPLRSVIARRFMEMVQDGEEYWNRYAMDPESDR